MNEKMRRIKKISALFLAIVFLFSQAALTVNAASTVGCWYFDAGSGTSLVDSSGNGNTGTLSTNYSNPAWNWIWNYDYYGLRFDNNYNDNVNIPNKSTYNFTSTGSFTLTAWVKRNTWNQSRWQGVVTKGGGSLSVCSSWYGIWITGDNKWCFGGANNPTVQNIIGSSVTDGWHFVAAVQDGAANKRYLYVDGSLVASGYAMNASNTKALEVAGVDGVSEYFSGKVDEVYLYDYALSASTISSRAQLHNTNLNVRAYTQQPYGNLCWATSIAMIVSYFNDDVNNYRDAIAQDYTHSTTNFDVAAPGSGADLAIHYVNSYCGINGTNHTSSISFADVKTQIGRRGPIYSRIGWKDGSGNLTGNGHVHAMKGYYESGSTQGVYINDPSDGAEHYYSYSGYVSNSSFNWTDTVTFK
ncbi:MAG: LamG-like jellyroll fold domain-containing protein [Bacillota bacterium]|nr:LamG-like jellyroll fold domain-containing protein [Bacillota bacterium]